MAEPHAHAGTHAFGDAFRKEVARRLAGFTRMPAGPETAGLTRAAVAIALTRSLDGSGEATFLLTRRTDRLRAHGGQWALPGGRCDDGETAIEAALRELEEELAVCLDPSSVLGLLDDYPTRSGYLITPVVVWAGADPTVSINPGEVASVHRIRIADIMRPDVVEFVTIPESARRVIRLIMNGVRVHAPTAAMIYQLREMLAGRTTRVDQMEQPVFAWR
ncbi:MAG TPA: CoA pyrophosphatase [Hyphomicrobiaceae bacterium]|nr:CoA pyrophosphatase [Hyphomicrobiaceae bacterium]